MKSMIGSLTKGDVCHYILSTKTFNANQVVAGNPQIIDIGNQPIYSSMSTSGTPGPALISANTTNPASAGTISCLGSSDGDGLGYGQSWKSVTKMLGVT